MAERQRSPNDSDSGKVPLRDLWEQMVQRTEMGNKEMAALRAELLEFRKGVEPLIRAIRGGEGEEGLLTMMALAHSRMAALDEEMKGFRTVGTGPSQRDLALVHQQLLQQGLRLDQIDKKMNERDEARHKMRDEINARILKSDAERMKAEHDMHESAAKVERRYDDKRWQFLVFLVTSFLTMLGVMVSIALHFMGGK